MTTALNIADQMNSVIANVSRRRNAPYWPPDLFAICASILHVSGAYCVASCNWPPRKNWVDQVTKVASEWRKVFKSRVPARVQELWCEITSADAKRTPISELSQKRSLCEALIELLSIADETCYGVGIPFDPSIGESFASEAEFTLISSNWEGAATLCLEAAKSAVRVLPKMHVPTSGFTLRSFSHYLAFIPSSEIKPYRHPIGTAPIEDETLDVLILPWPLHVEATDFKPVKASAATMRNLPKSFGFFEFTHENSLDTVESVLEAVRKISASLVDRKIDAVVMPELSLNEGNYSKLSSLLLQMGIFLIAGVSGPRKENNPPQNTVRFNIPLGSSGGEGAVVPTTQAKHHRWKLESQQIQRYGLNLSKSRSFWEHIPIGDRKLSFLCLREWLALCLLICEDLARPDPVGDVIRAVGPNLVIALLLDGPQMDNRWSARYATALADDPGSSVLTLTCAGMVRRSRGKRADTGKVALWKDILGQTRLIDIRSGDAALLHIKVENRTGWTVDGRNDGKTSGYPILRSFQSFKRGKLLKETTYV